MKKALTIETRKEHSPAKENMKDASPRFGKPDIKYDL